MAGPIRISILANANQAISAFNKSGNAAQGFGDRVGRVSGVLKTALVGAGIYKGLEVLTSQFTDATAAVQEQEKLLQQTGAVLKSTGGIANVTAKDVLSLSDALEKKSLIDAEAIQNGQNLLLTFTNIRNEAGRGNDIFTRTTKTMVDLATAMGSDPQTAAVQLGKALNDPIKGVTALSKVGVSFTQQQKDQIKALVETGDLLGAQKIILGEVNKEFGGSGAAAADTAAGSFKRLKDTIDGVFEGIVSRALPVLANLADYLTSNVPAALNTIKPAVDGVKSAFESMLTQLQPVQDFFREHPEVIKGAAIALGIAAGAALALAAAMGVLSVATSPITLVILAIAAVGGAVAYAYKNSEQFRNAVQTLGQVFQSQVLPALKSFGSYITGTVVPAVIRVAQAVGANLKPVFTQLAATFTGQVLPAVQRAAAKFQEWWPTIKRVATAAAEMGARLGVAASIVLGKVLPVVIRFAAFAAGALVSSIINFVRRLAEGASALGRFGGAIGTAISKVAQFASRVASKIGEVVGFFIGLPGRITGAIGDLGSLLYNAGASIIQGLLNGIESKIGAVKSKLSQLTNLIPKLKGPPTRDKVLLKPAGIDIMNGLVAGFTQGSQGVEAALTAITDHIEKTFDKQLSSAQKRIKSKYDAIEKDLKKRLDGKALKNALAKNDKAREKAEKRAEKNSTQAQKALLAQTKDLRAAIVANGAAQDDANGKLSEAANTLQSMRDSAQQYADAIRDAIVATGSLSTLGQGDGYADVQQLLDLRQSALTRAQEFSEVINGLTAAGLNSNDLQDLISQGAENGLAVAKALLAGGPAVITQMNTLSAGLVLAGQTLGNNVSNTLYGAGIQAQQSLVNGLQADVNALLATAQNLGAQVAAAIAQGLQGGQSEVWHVAGKTADGTTKKVKNQWRIASPSKVFRALAENVTKGLVIGLDGTAVERQGVRLASALTNGFGTPALDAMLSGSANGSSSQSIEVRFTAEQIDALSRGRSILADIDAARSAGFRSAA